MHLRDSWDSTDDPGYRMGYRRIASTTDEIIVGIVRSDLTSSDPQHKEQDAVGPLDEWIPLDSGVIDVEDYGITPDASPMDPKLWIDMVTDTIGNGSSSTRAFYFKRDGVYEFTNRLDWYDARGNKQSQVEIIGKSRDGTVIRLAANSRGYENPYDAPKSFIRFDSVPAQNNNGFRNSIRQCTVEIGKGNPAAIAIEHNGNNNSHIRNVRIRSEDGLGITGIGYGYRNYTNGPCIVKNCVIEGFDYGISTAADPGELNEMLTFEDVYIRYPRYAGVNMFKVVACIFRRLDYLGLAPAILSRSLYSHLTLIDSKLSWSGSEGIDIKPTAAIYLRGESQTSPAMALIRNVSAPGFDAAIAIGAGSDNAAVDPGTANANYKSGTPIPGNYIEEFVYPSQSRPKVGSPGTLGLPIVETPELIFTDPGDFVSIERFGATRHNKADAENPANSSRAAIQAAIDSGAKVVYAQGYTLSPERGPTQAIVFYGIDGPIYLRGDCQKFMSLGHCALRRSTGYTGPLLIGDSGSAGTVEIYGWYEVDQEASPTVQLTSARNFLFRYVEWGAYMGTIEVSNGAVMLWEDSVAYGNSADPLIKVQSGSYLYARSLDLERFNSTPDTLLLNDGGTVWALSYKTELGSQILKALNGAKSEILGGYHIQTQLAVGPMIANEDSQLCFAGTTATYDGIHPVNPLVVETVDSVPMSVNRSDMAVGTRPGLGVSLYTGQKP